MATRRFLFAFHIILTCASIARPQSYDLDEQWRWVHFTTESGLPSNDVLELAETADGTVWVGTGSGLARFDGYQWRRPDDRLAIPEARVTRLEARGNKLLALVGSKTFYGTSESLALIFDSVAQVSLVSPESVITVLSDSLQVYSKAQFAYFSGSPPLHNVKAADKHILHSTGSGLWVEATDGLYRYHNGSWSKAIALVPGDQMNVHMVVEDPEENAYAVLGLPLNLLGLWEWREDEHARRNADQGLSSIMQLAAGPRGDLVAIYQSGEIGVRRGGAWSVIPDRRLAISFVRFRPNGDLWFGTKKNGLYLFRATSNRWSFARHPGPDYGNRVNEIIQARSGDIYLATPAGIEMWKPGMAEPRRLPGPTGMKVLTGLAEDGEGNIWASSGGGLRGVLKWDGRRWESRSITPGEAPFIHKIRKDRRGRLWFLGLRQKMDDATAGPGAFVLDNGKFVRWGVEEGLPSGRVYAFAEDSGGAYWFGTLQGISRWKDGIWKHWTIAQGLRVSRIFALTVDPEGKVWFSHQGDDLGCIDRDEVARYVIAHSGVRDPVTEIWDLSTDSLGRLWISNRTSIKCYHKGKVLTFTPLGGAPDLIMWPILPVGHRVLVGTSGYGLAILNTREIDDPFPRLSIAAPILEENSAFLRWRTYGYWGSPGVDEILTRHRVDDGAWSTWSTARDIVLHEMTTGEHTFRLEVQNLSGLVDTTGELVSFSVPGPFYMKPSFFMPVAAMSAALVILGSFYVQRRRRHSAELRKSELKFRRLTEATFEGVIIHEGGVILEANRGALLMFGYELGEVVGRNFADFASPDSREAIRRNIISDGERPYEVSAVRKDGTPIVVEVSAKTLPYENRMVRVASIRDITERKATERKLLAYQRQLRSLASELAVTNDRERRRMAGYLHDTIGQTLAFCKLKIGALQEFISGEDGKKTLSELRGLVDESIHGTRSLTFELSPPILHELGFGDAVEWLAERMRAEHRLEVMITIDGDNSDLDEDVRIALFNAVRELLVNVVKHSGVRSACVSIHRSPRQLEVRVSDDGIGFDPSVPVMHYSKDGSGFGLFSIRERIHSIGGAVKITSAHGKGTLITMVVPTNPATDPTPEAI